MKLVFMIMAFLGSTILYSQDTLALKTFINEWWQVPYKFGGSTKFGIDCSKYTQRLYKDVFGLDIPGVSWKQWEATERVERDSLRMGDLVFFRSTKSPSGWHVGVYLWKNLFVHSANRREDMLISNLEEDRYKKGYRGAGRILRRGL